MPTATDRLDGFQRRHPVVGYPLAVLYKFFDDQGSYLAVVLTYYSFVAIFPMLLIASSVLGFVLQGNEELQKEVLQSALGQFPIVGTQIGQPAGIQGSTSAVVVGTVTALYGVLGLGQAAQNAVNVAWAVPRNSRLNPVVSRLRSFVMLVLAGLTVLAVAVLTSLASHTEILGYNVTGGVRILLTVASVVLNALVLSVLLRLATSRKGSVWAALPGGFTIAVLWQGLQSLGGLYVTRVINRVDDMNGVFAVVLGLIALLYIASVMAVFGVQVNAVLGKNLYPRALLTPFTDDVDLTDADRRVYADRAKAQRYKGFQRVRVSFEPEGGSSSERPSEPDRT